jgi:putative hydrolase of the HAD superfamily
MLILFDIDDTLLDHSGAVRSAAMTLHEITGPPMGVEEFLLHWAAALERHFGRYLAGEITYQGQRRARVREVIDATLSDDAADQLFSRYLAAYEGAWSLFPDVRPCLGQLSQHRLGVISNGQTHQQRKKLMQTGIADRFECILISEECGCAKPSEDIFLRACAATGASPVNALYVGDQYELDAEAARRAGLLGVWLDRHGKATPRHSPPVIRTLAISQASWAEVVIQDLLDRVRRWASQRLDIRGLALVGSHAGKRADPDSDEPWPRRFETPRQLSFDDAAEYRRHVDCSMPTGRLPSAGRATWPRTWQGRDAPSQTWPSRDARPQTPQAGRGRSLCRVGTPPCRSCR